MGVDAAMAAVETGDMPRLTGLLQAVPALVSMPFVTPYLIAVLTVLTEADPSTDEELPEPAVLIATAAEQATDTQREAAAARLRRLARRVPDKAAALEDLATTLLRTAPAQPAHPPQPSGDAR